jgi:hypothetical protein
MLQAVCNKKTLFTSNQLVRPSMAEFQKEFFDGIYSYLSGAKYYYPEFEVWYYDKVLPEIISGERNLIVKQRGESIAGIAIVKFSECKLCTLKVLKEYRNVGYGIWLFEKAFEILKSEKPFLTVSEEIYPDFRRVFEYFGFRLTNIKIGLYRVGKCEYYFNEI